MVSLTNKEIGLGCDFFELISLLVRPDSGPISRTLEILITPPYLSPVNSEVTIVFSAPKLV